MEMKMIHGFKPRFTAALVAMATLGLPVSASANDPNNPWYMRTGVGLHIVQDNEIDATGTNIDYDPGFSINTAVGYRITEMFRVEGELGANVAEVDNSDADLNELRFLVGGIAEIPNVELLETPVAPFAGAGLGLAWSKIDGSDREPAFTLQIEIGIEAQVTDSLWVGPAYRFQYGTYDGDGDLEDRQFAHVLNFLNARIEF